MPIETPPAELHFTTWLPLGFHEWMPAAQAVTLGLLTFVQEDVPTVSAALLAAAGNLTWQAGFLGVLPRHLDWRRAALSARARCRATVVATLVGEALLRPRSRRAQRAMVR